MAYHLENSQLRVVRKYCCESRNRTALKKSRLIFLMHILPTTEEFIKHLVDAGAEVFSIFMKPYSIDPSVHKRLAMAGYRLISLSYDELDVSGYLDAHLQEALALCRKDGRQLAIVEVGGYFAAPLSRLSSDDAAMIAGVVEDTTYGHNRYKVLAQKIPIPIFSVARSQLKEIEARYVGRDAVTAVDILLRELGVSLPGRNALMIGYGMIGTNVARSLRSFDLNVYVYDMLDYRNLRAFNDGFHIHQKRELLKLADIIFSATGSKALRYDEIESCRDNVILTSVGSRDTEFDIAMLREQAVSTTPLCKDIVKYKLQNSNNVMVVRDGTAVNFSLRSLPIEVIDLVFSEIFVCLMRLFNKSSEHKLGILHEASEPNLNAISKDWLRFVNK